MLIETNNLIIREYREEDAGELFEILSDPITMSFWPEPYTMEGVKSWIERSIRSYEEHGFGRYAVILKETGRIIGDCGIVRSTLDGEEVVDFGYIIHHDYWGKGYATEAAIAVRDYAFSVLGLNTLHINMPYNHDASRKVAEKLGAVKVREFENAKNRNIRTFLYVLRQKGLQ